jgi:hypothetical protein
VRQPGLSARYEPARLGPPLGSCARASAVHAMAAARCRPGLKPPGMNHILRCLGLGFLIWGFWDFDGVLPNDLLLIAEM